MLRRRYKQIISILAIPLLFLILGVVYAAFVNQHILSGRVETSGVNIKLEQFTESDEGLVYATDSTASPGEFISYIPVITNLQADSYVRINMDIRHHENEIVPITADMVSDIGDGWIQKGDSFYFSEVLRSGNSEELFKGINIPASWNMDTASDFEIELTADAVQAKNFHPDFNAANPWGSVTIDKNKYLNDSSVIYRVATPGLPKDLVYKENKTFECTTLDIFDEFNSLMPGDVYESGLTLANRSRSRTNIYFKIRNTSSALKETVGLEIRSDNKTLYSGNLDDSTMGEFIKLTQIDAGEQKRLDFEISLPKEAGNEYENLRDDTLWIFATEDINGAGGTEVKTGDPEGNLLLLMIILSTLMAIMTLGLLLVLKRK